MAEPLSPPASATSARSTSISALSQAADMQPAVAHFLQLAARLAEQIVGIPEPSLHPGGNPGQLQRLRVEHRGALRRAQLVAKAGHLGGAGVLVDLVGQRQGDEAAAQRILVLLVDDVGDSDLQLLERLRRILLVELVDRPIVAQQPLDDAIALGRGAVGRRQQALGRREIAQVRLLQALVGQRLGTRSGVIALAVGKILEELGGFGEATAIVAGIGFGPGRGRVIGACLGAGESRRVAHLGCRDLNRALLRLVVDHRSERQAQRRVVAGQALDEVVRLAARHEVAAIVELAGFVAAIEAGDGADMSRRWRWPARCS